MHGDSGHRRISLPTESRFQFWHFCKKVTDDEENLAKENSFGSWIVVLHFPKLWTCATPSNWILPLIKDNSHFKLGIGSNF